MTTGPESIGIDREEAIVFFLKESRDPILRELDAILSHSLGAGETEWSPKMPTASSQIERRLSYYVSLSQLRSSIVPVVSSQSNTASKPNVVLGQIQINRGIYLSSGGKPVNSVGGSVEIDPERIHSLWARIDNQANSTRAIPSGEIRLAANIAAARQSTMFLDSIYSRADSNEFHRGALEIFAKLDGLMHSGDFATCDQILANADVQRLKHEDLILSFLTITCAANPADLPSRAKFFSRAKAAIEASDGKQYANELLDQFQ